MKKRTMNYLKRQKAFRQMLAFTDLKSLLMASFHTSRSLVVKKDILEILQQLNRTPSYALARI